MTLANKYRQDAASCDRAAVAIDSDISGRGEGAEQDAIKAIGEALGYRDTILVDFHP